MRPGLLPGFGKLLQELSVCLTGEKFEIQSCTRWVGGGGFNVLGRIFGEDKSGKKRVEGNPRCKQRNGEEEKVKS